MLSLRLVPSKRRLCAGTRGRGLESKHPSPHEVQGCSLAPAPPPLLPCGCLACPPIRPEPTKQDHGLGPQTERQGDREQTGLCKRGWLPRKGGPSPPSQIPAGHQEAAGLPGRRHQRPVTARVAGLTNRDGRGLQHQVISQQPLCLWARASAPSMLLSAQGCVAEDGPGGPPTWLGRMGCRRLWLQATPLQQVTPSWVL